MQTLKKQSLVLLLLLGFSANTIGQNGERFFDFDEEEMEEKSVIVQNIKIKAGKTIQAEKIVKKQNIVRVTESGAVIAFDDSIFDDIKPAKPTQKYKKGIFGELIPIKTDKIDTLYYNKKFKAFPAEYTGYSIQLYSANEPLSNDHWLKSEFVGIMENVNIQPKYTYLLGTFSNKVNAENFLKTMVKKRIATAKIIEFNKGESVSDW